MTECATIRFAVAGRVILGVAIMVGGCAKVKPNDPRQTEGAKIEAKRHQTACASSAAYARLKNIIFDQAVRGRGGDSANLDTLADYSTIRMDDPVVAGFDPSLDITRCRGRLILEIPPGAERGFAGERRLQSDVDYTAQAAADGSGFVYQLTGAEPVIAKLAAFQLTSVAFRPPPAIDEPQAVPGESEEASVNPPSRVTDGPPARSVSSASHGPTSQTRPPVGRGEDRADRESGNSMPTSSGSRGGEATVRTFYAALGAGSGSAASAQVIPEKRAGGAFSPDALSRFYGRLPEPIRLTELVPLDRGTYRVRYRYSTGRSRCDGSAVVRVESHDGHDLIRSIRALNGC